MRTRTPFMCITSATLLLARVKPMHVSAMFGCEKQPIHSARLQSRLFGAPIENRG